jgi:hypothetical protein
MKTNQAQTLHHLHILCLTHPLNKTKGIKKTCMQIKNKNFKKAQNLNNRGSRFQATKSKTSCNRERVLERAEKTKRQSQKHRAIERES